MDLCISWRRPYFFLLYIMIFLGGGGFVLIHPSQKGRHRHVLPWRRCLLTNLSPRYVILCYCYIQIIITAYGTRPWVLWSPPQYIPPFGFWMTIPLSCWEYCSDAIPHSQLEYPYLLDSFPPGTQPLSRPLTIELKSEMKVFKIFILSTEKKK